MTSINFWIEGAPVGKARPRFRKNGMTYTPKATTVYEQAVAASFQLANADAHFRPEKDQALAISVIAYYPIPESHPKYRKERERDNVELPTKKPDIDNILKIIMDGLNGVAYDDDKQIVEVTAAKRFREVPGVYVSIKEVGG